MNEIGNKFLLAGDKFMPEIHLRQPRFTYSACEPFTKTRKDYKSLKKLEHLRHIYQIGLNKLCFQHGMACGDFKHLILLKIRIMMDIKEILLQWFINFLIKNF